MYETSVSVSLLKSKIVFFPQSLAHIIRANGNYFGMIIYSLVWQVL